MNENDIIRTPDRYFENLPDFPFQPHYIEILGRRIHYVDVGNKNSAEVILCLHGAPTWAYLYRKMILPLAHYHRVIAMDFVGFGRSDKLADQEAYSFKLHKDTLEGFIDELDLDDITLVVHDWGGLIGLTLASERVERFYRLVIMNTGLPIGEEPMPDEFLRWRRFCERLSTRIPVGRVIKGGLANPKQISAGELAAYEAPFPDNSYKVGAAVWPLLVPLNSEDPGAKEMRAARRVLSSWTEPVLVMFSDSDPITRGGATFFRNLIPGARDQPQITIKNAGHYLQEEKGEDLANYISSFVSRTPQNQD